MDCEVKKHNDEFQDEKFAVAWRSWRKLL